MEPISTFLVVVDTNQGTSGFYQQLCAFMTGWFGDDEEGDPDPYLRPYVEDFEIVSSDGWGDYFRDILLPRPNLHGNWLPCSPIVLEDSHPSVQKSHVSDAILQRLNSLLGDQDGNSSIWEATPDSYTSALLFFEEKPSPEALAFLFERAKAFPLFYEDQKDLENPLEIIKIRVVHEKTTFTQEECYE